VATYRGQGWFSVAVGEAERWKRLGRLVVEEGGAYFL